MDCFWLVTVSSPELSWENRWADSGLSVKEQALSDLTGSILATFTGMSNMFLPSPQVIDSRTQSQAHAG